MTQWLIDWANFFMDDTLSGFIKFGIAKPAPLAFAHTSQKKYRITDTRPHSPGRSSKHGREAYPNVFEKEKEFTDRALWQAEIGKPESKPNKEVAEPCKGLLEGLFQEMERSSQDSFTLSTRFECQKNESDPKSPHWVPYTFYFSCQKLFPFAPTSPSSSNWLGQLFYGWYPVWFYKMWDCKTCPSGFCSYLPKEIPNNRCLTPQPRTIF